VEGRIGIDDECACFSFRTLQQTQDQIRQLVAAYHLEVLVETTQGKIVAVTDNPNDLKRELGDYGVYLRIDKNASEVQVQVSDALQKQGLTDARLRQVVEPHLRNKQYDRGLCEGVRFLVQFEEEQNAKKAP
jgi:TPM domain